MKKAKKIVVVCLSVLLLLVLLCSCNNKNENQLSFEKAPAEQPIHLNSDNFVEMLSMYYHSGATFVLDDNIELKGEWTPIARTLSTAFNGTIDGRGNSIKYLKITGWDEDGNPKYIAKRIMGWKKDGTTPVYRSSEIVSMQTKSTSDYKDGKNDENIKDDLTEVTEIIYEGDNADPNYADMEKEGYFESTTSYGSVGLFGYTYGATFKDLTIEGADISFYGEGENVYAGIISGCDVASTFDNVTIKDCTIHASDIRTVDISYHYETAKPKQAMAENYSKTKQYIGGLVGYTHNMSDKTSTKFIGVNVLNVELDNNNYSAYFDSKLEATYYDYSNENSYILTTKLTNEEIGMLSDAKKRTSFYEIDTSINLQCFIGGVAGYMYGAEIKNVMVDGLNSNGGATMSSNKVNAGGVAATLIGDKSSVQKVAVRNVSFITKEVNKNALVGGAFGEIKSAKVNKDTSTVENISFDIGTSSPDSVCAAGFAGYCDEKAEIKNVTVCNASLTSNYTASGKLGAILAGLIGVLRDSTATNSSVKNIAFTIEGSETTNDYCYTTDLVSQVYGNSVLNNLNASDCTYVGGEWNVVKPSVIAKNNYVNENGESSIRLYYTLEDGRQAGVYITVYGRVIPFMVDGDKSYKLEEETIYVSKDENGNEFVVSKENDIITDFNNTFYYISEGYFPRNYGTEDEKEMTEENIAREKKWYQLYKDTAEDPYNDLFNFKKYHEEFVYGKSRVMYHIVSYEVGSVIPDGVCVYYYATTADKKAGTLEKATGRFEAGKEYYIDADKVSTWRYEIEIIAYSESDKEIGKATYDIQALKDEVIVDDYGTKFIKCPAELYSDSYIEVGKGFKNAKSGGIRDDSGNFNRDFSKYQSEPEWGRPIIDADSIKYQ